MPDKIQTYFSTTTIHSFTVLFHSGRRVPHIVFAVESRANVQGKFQGQAHKVRSSKYYCSFFHATETCHRVRLIEPTL